MNGTAQAYDPPGGGTRGRHGSHQALTAALLDCVAFLELSDEQVVDPDAAVKQLESIAHALRQAPAAEREELVTTIQALTAAEDDPDRWALFATTPEALNLRGR